MLTARDGEMDVVLGLTAGADDYVAKPFRLGELLARIGTQLRRAESVNGGGVLIVGDLVVDAGARTAHRAGAELDLRPREFDLLAMLARNAGRAVPRDRILTELWRDYWGGASKTLDMHISSLRRRLGEPDPITTLRGIGYRLELPG
jgi:DNA-binding response OmpR family regulator